MKLLNIFLELLKRDVSLVGVRDENRPLISGEFLRVETPVLIVNSSSAPKRIGASIDRIVKQLQGSCVDQRAPNDIAAIDGATQSAWEEKIVLVEMFNDCRSRTGALKNAEEQLNRLTDALVGIHDDTILQIMHVSDGKGGLEFSPASFIQNAAAKSGPQYVKLRFTHGSLESE